MGEMIVYVDRSTVRDGKLQALKAAMRELVDFVEANEPDILAYDVYFSEDGRQMTVVHMHADPTSLAHHMKVAGPMFPPIGAFLTIEQINVYGDPGPELTDRIRSKASTLGTGEVSVHRLHHGVERVSVP